MSNGNIEYPIGPWMTEEGGEVYQTEYQGITLQMFFSFLRGLLSSAVSKAHPDWNDKEIDAEVTKEMTWVSNDIMDNGFGPQTPYIGDCVAYYAGIAQNIPALTPPVEQGATGGYETQVVAGNTLAILRNDAGIVVDTINLGATETGAITPYQQAELDRLNQQYQTQQQQWAIETALGQYQYQQQLAAQQQQLGYQASSQQAGLGLQAQLAALPYQGMTVAEQAQTDLQRRQYLAEVMANPTRWIEGYYAQDMQQPPWTTTATTMPQIQVPQVQVPQMQPVEFPPWFGPQTLEDLLAQLLLQPEVPPVEPTPTPTQQYAQQSAQAQQAYQRAVKTTPASAAGQYAVTAEGKYAKKPGVW